MRRNIRVFLRAALAAGHLFLCPALILAPAGLAQASDSIEVKMLDKGPNGQPKVFDPAFLQIEPGQTVEFVAWDFGHDLESVDGLIPEGAEPFDAPKNAGTTVTFQREGVYVYRCAAHKLIGMVGVIVVGDPSPNLDAVLAAYPKNETLSDGVRERLAGLLAQAKSLTVATK